MIGPGRSGSSWRGVAVIRDPPLGQSPECERAKQGPPRVRAWVPVAFADMDAVGLLHPGEMGAAVGALLVARGHEVLWASEGRSDATAARARAAGLTDAGSVAALADRSAVVLSVCPPHAALEVAAALAGFEGTFVDANAIAPATARAAAELVGDAFVDGGIVGPPPREPGDARLFLSGARAGEIAAVFAGQRARAGGGGR